MESHSIWFHSCFVCFLSILKGPDIITPNEEEISAAGTREVRRRGIQCDHLGDIHKNEAVMVRFRYIPKHKSWKATTSALMSGIPKTQTTWQMGEGLGWCFWHIKTRVVTVVPNCHGTEVWCIQPHAEYTVCRPMKIMWNQWSQVRVPLCYQQHMTLAQQSLQEQHWASKPIWHSGQTV